MVGEVVRSGTTNHGGRGMARKVSRNRRGGPTIGFERISDYTFHAKNAESLQIKNRKADVFYLRKGKIHTGNPRYYAGKKLTGTPLAALPSGYEFYERTDNAQVVLRKIKPSSISELERKQVEEIIRRTSGLSQFVVEVDGNALVVHTPSMKS